MKILVAEQDALIRNLIIRSLREDGYQVITAVSAVEIVPQLEETAVDLLLVGHRPPQLDGATLVEQVNTPVVAMTMAGADQIGLQRAGVSAVISSPFDVAELLAVVDRFNL